MLRAEAHVVFDRLWKEKRMSRALAYRLLEKHIGIKHIADADEHDCLMIITHFKP